MFFIVVIISIVVAVSLAPKNSYFITNFLYYWTPQAVIVGLLFGFRVRLSVITGTLISMILTLLSYYIWISSSTDPSAATAWIGYFFVITGAFTGSFIYGLLIRNKKELKDKKSIIKAMLYSLLGTITVQVVLCLTLLHC